MSDIGGLKQALSGGSAWQPPKTNIIKAPSDPARVERMKQALEGLYSRPDGSVPEGYGTYAEVKVRGKVVATLANSGAATLWSNDDGGRVGRLADGEGPTIARRRAEQIAQALGGTVVKAGSAMTEEQWAARPPIKTVVDYEAMAADPLYGFLQKLSQASTLFSAQQLAQESTSSDQQPGDQQ